MCRCNCIEHKRFYPNEHAFSCGRTMESRSRHRHLDAQRRYCTDSEGRSHCLASSSATIPLRRAEVERRRCHCRPRQAAGLMCKRTVRRNHRNSIAEHSKAGYERKKLYQEICDTQQYPGHTPETMSAHREGVHQRKALNKKLFLLK